jgi:hypothetical protein
MRAKMSSQDARGGNGMGTLLQFTRAQQALDEATRIMAETEPDDAHPFDGAALSLEALEEQLHEYACWGVASVDAEAAVALVDALTTFTANEVA